MTQSPQEKLAARLSELAEVHERDAREADSDFWRQAMASEAATLREAATLLSEHGEVTVTTDESGRCVAVTRQDSEGRILSTIWAASEHGGGGEAVYQVRRRHDPIYKNPPWSEVSKGNYESLASYAGYERRILYTTPPTPSAPVGVGDLTIRELQTRLPWTIRYSRDFRASPAAHKDFAHALHHVSKAAGKLHALADDMDHDREVADDPALRNSYGKYVADLVVCALRLANTFPGGVLDLQQATQARIEDKNGVALTPAAAPRGDAFELCDECLRLDRLCDKHAHLPGTLESFIADQKPAASEDGLHADLAYLRNGELLDRDARTNLRAIADRIERRLAASGDAYVSEQGSVTVDWDDDPQRQLSIMVKPDGSVSFAALANGQRFSGDAKSPEFWRALSALAASGQGVEPVRDAQGNTICICTHDALCPIHATQEGK